MLWTDYTVNHSYYEMLCINKDNPELHCQGKCQLAEKSSKSDLSQEAHFISFQCFDFIPVASFSLEENIFRLGYTLENTFFLTENVKEAFVFLLPKPPSIFHHRFN